MLLALLVLLAAGGVGVYLTSREPQLAPAARYRLLPTPHSGNPLRFSAQGMGYPAVEIVMETNRGGQRQPRSRVLNDLCEPLDVAISSPDIRISPTRQVISWVDWLSSGVRFSLYARDGRVAQVPSPTGGVSGGGPWPCSDGVFGYLCSGKVDRVWLYTPDGRTLPAPPLTRGQSLAFMIASTAPGIIPLTDRRRVFLYDRTSHATVLATPFPLDTAMIWRHQQRWLLTPRSGYALVFDGAKQIASISPGRDGWRWGEDGTVWTLSGETLQVLRWRSGTPGLASLSTRGTPGTRYGSLAPGIRSLPPFRENTEPDWAAVWGDGRLVASVEQMAPMTNPMVRMAERAAQALHVTLNVHETRRLTLYRDRRRLGSFLLPVKPKKATITSSSPRRRGYGGPVLPARTENHEHLAFTGDGRYLSWAIDDGTGLRLFVFRVPSA